MYFDFILHRRSEEEGKESEITLEFELEGQGGLKCQRLREETAEGKDMVGRERRIGWPETRHTFIHSVNIY